jgi:putative membrane protein
MDSLIGLPAFFAYFGFAVVLLLLFGAIYIWITPHREMALIKAGNLSAAIAFGGALVGFALPLASAISNSVSIVDGFIWGAIALLIQALAFLAARLLMPSISNHIAGDSSAAGVFLAAISITVGIINAACMTY